MLVVCSQVGQGTANEVELLDLRQELERKEEKHELEKGRKKDTAQGMDGVAGCLVGEGSAFRTEH